MYSLFTMREELKKDGIISFGVKKWKIGKFPKEMVNIFFIPEKKIMIFKDEQKLWEYHL